MDAKTLTALKESIEHWRRLADGTNRKGEETGPRSCALCMAFAVGRDSINKCDGCPVSVKTGMKDCRNTPYYAAEAVFGAPTFRAAARKELEFLESLLPK